MNIKDIKMIQERCRKDPVFFAENVLGVSTLWHKQKEILSSVKENPVVCVCSGHSTGKTFVSAVCLLWFLYSHKDSIVLSTSSSWLQLEKVLWSTVRKLHQSSKIRLGGEVLTTSLRLDHGWYALGVSTDAAENFSGFHSQNILVVVDEASAIEKPIYEAIQGCLAGGVNTRFLMIGNPLSSSGVFYDLCKGSDSKTLYISSWEAAKVEGIGLASVEWCQARKAKWGEGSSLYQSRVLGEFPVEGDDCLIPLSWVERALNAEVETNEKSETIISCDVARFGSDETVIIVMRGRKIIDGVSFQGKDTMYTVGKCIDLYRRWGAVQFVVDDGGIGGGVSDRLREQNYLVAALNFGAKADEPELFENLKAEMCWQLRDDIRDCKIKLLNIGGLIEQLPTIKYGFSSTGKIKIESKEALRKRGVRSPDWPEALAMANYIRRKYYECSWEGFNSRTGEDRIFAKDASESIMALQEREFDFNDNFQLRCF